MRSNTRASEGKVEPNGASSETSALHAVCWPSPVLRIFFRDNCCESRAEVAALFSWRHVALRLCKRCITVCALHCLRRIAPYPAVQVGERAKSRQWQTLSVAKKEEKGTGSGVSAINHTLSPCKLQGKHQSAALGSIISPLVRYFKHCTAEVTDLSVNRSLLWLGRTVHLCKPYVFLNMEWCYTSLLM